MIVIWAPSYYRRGNRSSSLSLGRGWTQGTSVAPTPPAPPPVPTGLLIPVYFDWYVIRGDDGFLRVGVNPAQDISAWSLQLTIMERFGGSVLATLSYTPSLSSGISLISSGAKGVFQAHLGAATTTSWDEGAYACLVERTDTNNRIEVAAGYLLLT